jgi:hypothetical protein
MDLYGYNSLNGLYLSEEYVLQTRSITCVGSAICLLFWLRYDGSPFFHSNWFSHHFFRIRDNLNYSWWGAKEERLRGFVSTRCDDGIYRRKKSLYWFWTYHVVIWLNCGRRRCAAVSQFTHHYLLAHTVDACRELSSPYKFGGASMQSPHIVHPS